MALVCVTGGLGFVGTAVCDLLACRGYRVLCVDRLSADYAPGRGRDAARRLSAEGRTRVIVEDVARLDLDRLLAGAAGVIHLAGLPGVRSGHSRTALWEQNVSLAERVEAAAARTRARMVLASSSSVYGDAGGVPAREETAPAPLGEYAASKLAAERACLAAGGDAVVARLFTVFGPGQRPDMAISRWIGAIRARRPVDWHVHPGGARELTHVADAARGLVAALESGRPGEVYNVAGSGSHRMTHVLALLERELGARARLRRRPPSLEEPVVTAACGRKSDAELGYRPRAELLAGLRGQIASGAGVGAYAEGHPAGGQAERAKLERLDEGAVALIDGDARADFDYGLERLLDGIESRV